MAGVPADNVPNVTVVQPADGAYLNGIVALEARASDNGRVVSVEFSCPDNGRLEVIESVPWETTWDSDRFDEGVHTLKATATDDSNKTAETQIQITVDRTTEPLRSSSQGAARFPTAYLTHSMQTTTSRSTVWSCCWTGRSWRR